ncbi:hypothetical protein DFQ29_009250 [Apophysomyces sp. BC1021]|nr:hypothetical protein DFQ29_009250 [Apophysomyces sp. BC1021]
MNRPLRISDEAQTSKQPTKISINEDKPKSQNISEGKKLDLIAEKKRELDQVNQIKRTSEQLVMYFDHLTNMTDELSNSVQVLRLRVYGLLRGHLLAVAVVVAAGLRLVHVHNHIHVRVIEVVMTKGLDINTIPGRRHPEHADGLRRVATGRDRHHLLQEEDLVQQAKTVESIVVEYRYPEDAQRAIRTLNKVEFMGRPVFIREDREFESTSSSKDPRKAPEDCRLYVGNLPYSASWQDMKDLFRKAGRVLHTDIISDPETRRSTGSGLVVFDDPRDARTAIDTFHGYEWQGRTLEVCEVGTITERNRPPPHASRSANNGEPRESRPQRTERSESFHQGSDTGYAAANAPPPPAFSEGYDAYNATPPVPPQHFPVSTVGGPGASLSSHGPNQIFVNNLPYSTTWQDLIDLFRHVGPVVRSEILMANGHAKGSGLVRFEDFATCERAIDKFHGYLYGGRYLDIRVDKFSTPS